ncbi:MAG: lipid A deacylase LpxR family protein [Gemmatimonadaceae bacterium]
MRRIHAVMVAAFALALPLTARAQRAVAVRADNDAFNFWQRPWLRPDEEYTSGVRLTVTLDDAGVWAKHVAPLLGACRPADAPCATHSYAFGQDIFTAKRPKWEANALPGGRPDAGVLWFGARTRVTRRSDIAEAGWTLGVTGKPSLAEASQRLIHSLAPRYNRPIEWGAQVPAEPVFALHYDRRRLLSTGLLAVQPHGGASMGTLLTEARAGLSAQLESGLPVPLPQRAARLLGAINVAVEGDVTWRGVARNAMLSGTFFRSSPHVDLRPLVRELSLGVRVRWRVLDASWMAHQTSAEHVGRDMPHTWSTLELRWRPER